VRSEREEAKINLKSYKVKILMIKKIIKRFSRLKMWTEPLKALILNMSKERKKLLRS